MKRLISIFLTVILLALPLQAQESCEGCDDLVACEELLLEAGNQLDDMEQRLIETEAKLKRKQQQGPYMTPLRGTLQTIPAYRNLPPYAQVGIAGGIDVIILMGMTYLELTK